MFNKLTDFSYRRNWKEAVGFYIAYLLLMILVGSLLGGIIGSLFLPAAADFSGGFDFGVRVGTVVAVLISLLLSFAILAKKHLLNNFGLILLAIVAGILAFFGGGLLGLIPIAYLTTRENNQKPKAATRPVLE